MGRRFHHLLCNYRLIFRSLGIMLVAAVLIAHPVFALSDDLLDFYVANDIMFYDPDAANCDRSSMPSGDKITWIGDSLSESVLDKIQETFKGADTEDKTYGGVTYRLVRYNKFVDSDNADDNNYSGLNTAEMLVNNGDMREYLIFALGTNGSITEDNIETLVKKVGDKTKILLVTNFKINDASRYTSNNNAIKNAAQKYDNVAYADWYKAAESDPAGYIDTESDNLGVHLTSKGKEIFINTIKDGFSAAFGSMTSGGGASSVLGGENKNYAGETVWSEVELKRIEENRPFYEEASKKYGVPWQAIAVVHSQEHALLRDNPENGQGAYQLYSYTAGGTNSNKFVPSGPISDAEFARQTDIATSIMKGMIESAGLKVDSEEGVKMLFFTYNGQADQYKQKALDMGFSQEEADWGEGSPYVMNRYDERRDPASPNMHSAWPGRFTGDGVYTPGSVSMNFGTFVKYVAIGGAVGGGVCGDLTGFIGHVKGYAWPEHHDAHYVERMPDYADVVDNKRVKEGSYVGGTVLGVRGIDCGGFVTTLLNESGFDPDYNYGGDVSKGASNVTLGQLPYVIGSSDWEMVNSAWNVPISDESQLSPGDVAFSNCDSASDCGHTYVYVGEIEGFETHIASASYDGNTTHDKNDSGDYGRAPMAGYEGMFRDDAGAIIWYHKK